MVSPPQIETAFRSVARSLKTPAARSFDFAKWQSAFDACSDPSEDDADLLAAAEWAGTELRELADQFAECLTGMTTADAVMLAIASLNHEYAIAMRVSQAERDRISSEQPVSFDYLMNIRYEGGTGQRLSIQDNMEGAVDAIASWLFDAARIAPSNEERDPVDVASVMRRSIHYYTLRGVLKNQFDKALHLGHRIERGVLDVWQPHDWKLSELHQAWLGRAQAEILTDQIEIRERWLDLDERTRRALAPRKAVVGARIREGAAYLEVRRPAQMSHRMPSVLSDMAALRGSHLAIFLDDSMPAAPGLTAALLAEAWWVLADAATKIVSAALAGYKPGRVPANLMAGEIGRRELLRVLQATMSITCQQASDVVEFLTFSEGGGGNGKGRRGLWSAPLVHLPDRDAYLLPRPVFETGMTTYRVEAWLEKGGIDDDALEHRGDRYEVYFRRSLGEAISANSALPGVGFAHAGIAPTADFSEQIDLLFSLGGHAFVGEVKFFLTPADPHHWDRFYRQRLPDAAGQASRKAAALRERRDVLAQALKMSPSEAKQLEVIPIVVLNIGAGFSLEADGCRVVNASFLRAYLGSRHYRTGAALRYGRTAYERAAVYYENEVEASERFAAIMARPWTLDRFLRRMVRDETAYPRPTGGKFAIASAFRGDFTFEERREHEGLLAYVGSQEGARTGRP